jgi:hypothetical protein
VLVDQGHALRARQRARLGKALSMGARSPERKRVNQREARRRGRGRGGLAAGRRQPGPLPLARPRTGAGHCRHAVSPAPSRWRSCRHARRGRAARTAGRFSRAGQSCCRESSPSRALRLRSLRHLLRRCRPLKASFPGKIGACREDGAGCGSAKLGFGDDANHLSRSDAGCQEGREWWSGQPDSLWWEKLGAA